MEFCILITSGPYTHQASYSALHFTAAALQKGHKIRRIFFYQDGAYTATRLSCVPTDEFDLGKQWATLAEQYQLDLCVCVNAGLKRGIIDHDEAKRYAKEISSIHPAFRLTGLGQLVEGLTCAERFIVFGD